jgi:hypothetical protein
MAKFQLFKGNDGDFYFRLRANNGEPILASEGYESKAGAENGIQSAKDNAPNDARYTRETASNGQHFFTLRAGNNEVIGKSETYSSSAARDDGIEAVKSAAPGASIEDKTE